MTPVSLRLEFEVRDASGDKDPKPLIGKGSIDVDPAVLTRPSRAQGTGHIVGGGIGSDGAGELPYHAQEADKHLLFWWFSGLRSSIPSGFLVVFEKPNRSSFTFTFPFTK